METDFTNATITGCRTYGASAWNVTLVGTVQHNLVITKEGEPVVTVDDLEVAQFIYLLLNNQNLRRVIDTVTSKVVLILGRFTEHERMCLDAIRERLRHSNFSPIMFDFDKPSSKTLRARSRHWPGWPDSLSPTSPIRAVYRTNWPRWSRGRSSRSKRSSWKDSENTQCSPIS